MATVEPKSLYAVSPAEPQMTYFTVSIAQSAFLDTETNNGGRVSPCVHSDFATAPTTLEQSKLINRGSLRWKMMMESIGIRSNFKVHNIVTTYATDAGDTPIGTLAFGLVFDNPDFIPTTGTTIDGSTTTTTKAEFIRDKIAEALNSTRTENMAVFDPSTVDGTANANQLRTLSITAAPVMTTSTGEIVDAITVTEVSAFAPNTSGQLVTDSSLTYSAE